MNMHIPLQKILLIALVAAAAGGTAALVYGVAADAPAADRAAFQAGKEEIETYLRALEHYGRADYTEVEEVLTPLCSREPDFYQARMLLAKSRFMAEQYREARAELQDILRRRPNYPQARLWLVRTLLQLGEPEMARELTEELLTFDPQDHRLLYLAGRIAEQLDELPTAIDCYRSAVIAGETAAKPLLALSRMYFRFGELEQAEELLGRASAVAGPDSVISETLRNLRRKLQEER
jgi:tetratricopeptide (TPR) repeat protein